MRAGKLDRYVRIEYSQAVRGPDGHLADRWLTLCHAWAERIDQASGGEAFITGADQRANTQRRMYRMRYRRGIHPRMRIIDGHTAWEIDDVQEEGRHDALVLACHAHEVTSGGEVRG